MRVFIASLILIFSLQSWTKADDISEFEIEGISIGDSLLSHMSKKEIKKANEKENYLDEEERTLIRNFIIKIQKELSLN